MLPSDSGSLPDGEAPIERYVPQSLAELKAATRGSRSWLWHGYLASHNITLLTSLWKAGKSTLIAVLLARMKSGGTIAGLPVIAGRAVVISEEPPEQWIERSQLVDLDGHVDWLCLPFTGTPTEEAWLGLLDRIVRLYEERPIALLVIDSLSNLSPMRTENDAVQMLRPLQPLRRLTEQGVSVLIAHHPKKGVTLPGQAARGSGALAGFVDIIVEMDAVSPRPDDRRRLLRAFSRHSATPPSLVIEWTADGTDYRSLGPSAELTYAQGWPLVHALLEQSERPLTRRDILSRWPESALAPAKLTLWKWLGRAVEERRVLCSGRGTRRDPFHYQLPGMVEKWHRDFLESFTKELDQYDDPQKPAGREATPSADKAAMPTARPVDGTMPLDPVPRPEDKHETAAAATVSPNSPAPPPAEEPVRLPYPYNIMKPADVPEEVWKWARGAKGKG
jgi:hypothetical protein